MKTHLREKQEVYVIAMHEKNPHFYQFERHIQYNTQSLIGPLHRSIKC